MDLHQAIHRRLTARCVEPKRRLVGGQMGWAIHRFQIKGGITLTDVMSMNVCTHNALFNRLVGRG